MKKSLEYLKNMQKILADITEKQIDAIDATAQAFATALENDRSIFLYLSSPGG